MSAPILGGGHGWLQGQYGLASDQVVSARVVLPNGDAVTASEDINPDLFWALRGAGHNFGIVTEWGYRVHDVKNEKWAYEIFYFAGEKLEKVIEWSNQVMKTQPMEVTHWMYLVNIPEIMPDEVSALFTGGVEANGSSLLFGMRSSTMVPSTRPANMRNPSTILAL